MKKSLLLLASAFVAASAFAANDAVVYEDLMLQKMSSDANWLVSDDGSGSIVILDQANNKKYVCVGDADTGPNYSLGLGNCVSNNGVVLATTNLSGSDPAYWENGEWKLLPVDENDNGICHGNGITPDGTRICGIVGTAEISIDATSIMVLPVVWTKGADGNFGKYTILPHPELDFTGRIPQYITAVAISDDGKTIVGQIRDFTGMSPQPIVYTEGADGKWEYTLLMESLFNPEGTEWPVWPGDDAPYIQEYMTQAQLAAYQQAVEKYEEADAEHQANKPMPEDYLSPEERAQWEEAVANWDPMESYFPPSATDYMTEEEYAKYEADLNAWFAEAQGPNILDYMTEEEIEAYNKACEDYTGGKYPEYEDFISAQGLAKYNAALAEWKKNPLCYPDINDFVSPDKLAQFNADYEKWQTEFYAFMEKYEEVTESIPPFTYNNICISPNGKYVSSTAESFDWLTYESASSTYVFDLTTGDYLEKDAPGLVFWTGDEGQIVTAAPIMQTDRTSYITTSYEGEYVPFQDYIKEKNEDLYKWMEANMRHDYYYYDYDWDTGNEELKVEENKWFTGSVTPSSDMKTFVSWIANTWSEDFDDPYFYSYVFSIDYVAGLASAAADSNIEVNADNSGNITVKGDAANISVFDMSGREVYRGDSPANSFSTGLNSGMYIIKATGANGESKILKSAF